VNVFITVFSKIGRIRYGTGAIGGKRVRKKIYMPHEKYMKLNVELSGRLILLTLSKASVFWASSIISTSHRFSLSRRFPLVQLLMVEALINPQKGDFVTW